MPGFSNFKGVMHHVQLQSPSLLHTLIVSSSSLSAWPPSDSADKCTPLFSTLILLSLHSSFSICHGRYTSSLFFSSLSFSKVALATSFSSATRLTGLFFFFLRVHTNLSCKHSVTFLLFIRPLLLFSPFFLSTQTDIHASLHMGFNLPLSPKIFLAQAWDKGIITSKGSQGGACPLPPSWKEKWTIR